MTSTPHGSVPADEPAPAIARSLAVRGGVFVGVGAGVALLLGPVPIAVGLLLFGPAPAVGGVLVAVGVLAAIGGIVLMVLGAVRLRRRAALLLGAGLPQPRVHPALFVGQIAIGAMLLGVGAVAVVLANLAASVESPVGATVATAWMLAAAGLLSGAGLVIVGIVGLARLRGRRDGS